MRLIKFACAALAATLMLAACGSKGPLYLPQPSATATPPAPQAAPAAAAKDSNNASPGAAK